MNENNLKEFMEIKREDVIEVIKHIIKNSCGINNVGNTESLFNKKGIDSITMLYIINEVENKYNIRIPDDELLISNFETINQIASLVCRLVGKEEKNV